MENTEENRETLAWEIVYSWDKEALQQYCVDRMTEYLKDDLDFQETLDARKRHGVTL